MSLFYIVHRFLFPSRFEAKMGEISEKTLKNHVFRKVSILRWRDFEKFCSKGSCPGSAELPLTSVVQATRYRQPWTRGTTAKKLLWERTPAKRRRLMNRSQFRRLLNGSFSAVSVNGAVFASVNTCKYECKFSKRMSRFVKQPNLWTKRFFESWPEHCLRVMFFTRGEWLSKSQLVEIPIIVKSHFVKVPIRSLKRHRAAAPPRVLFQWIHPKAWWSHQLRIQPG